MANYFKDMARIKVSNLWWTAPAESENGSTIIVTGRKDLEAVYQSGKFVYRVEITWKYHPDNMGMPDFATSSLMEKVTDALNDSFNADPVAILTGIYTGDGERNLVFYCRSLNIFQRKFNEILSPFPTLPLSFQAFNDPEWEEYHEMRETEIPDDE